MQQHSKRFERIKAARWIRVILIIAFSIGQWIMKQPNPISVHGQSGNQGEYTIYLPLVMRQDGILLEVMPQPGAPYQIGQYLRVDIRILTAEAVRQIRMKMIFHPGVVNCQAVRAGQFFTDWATRNNMRLIFQPGAIDNTNGVINDSTIRLAGKPADERQPAGPSGSGIAFSLDCMIVGAGISPLDLIKAIVINNDADWPEKNNAEIRNAQIEVNVLVSSVGQTHIDAQVEPLLKIAVDAELPKHEEAGKPLSAKGAIQVSSNSHYQVEVIQPGNIEPLFMQALGFRLVSEPRGTLLTGYTEKQVDGERMFTVNIYSPRWSEQSGTRLVIFHGFILV